MWKNRYAGVGSEGWKESRNGWGGYTEIKRWGRKSSGVCRKLWGFYKEWCCESA